MPLRRLEVLRQAVAVAVEVRAVRTWPMHGFRNPSLLMQDREARSPVQAPPAKKSKGGRRQRDPW